MSLLTRRGALFGAAAATVYAAVRTNTALAQAAGPFSLPALPYRARGQ